MTTTPPPPPPPPDSPPPPPPPPPPPSSANPYTAAEPPLSPADEKMWAILTHVGGILLGWIAPLITYLVFKDRGPFIRAHATTALNFQLTVIIMYVGSFVLMFVLIGIFTAIAAGILVIVFSIMAAVAANGGRYYTYPLSIPFVK